MARIDKINEILAEIATKEHNEDIKEAQELVEQVKIERSNDVNYWDVPKDLKIDYFDPLLSYELTGYRPISETAGLDFKPEWFTETREVYLKTGHYCTYLPGSKRYNEFWLELYKRCKYGMTVNGYTITGDNYFFLNFYQLPVINTNKAAGEGIDETFPNFMASQYVFFHYLNLCRALKKNACLLKARSIGFSEINASVAARMYFIIRKSRVAIVCHKEGYVKDTFGKFKHAVTFCNTSTDGGMFEPELANSELRIMSGYQEKINGQFENFGFLSEVVGIVADKPNKIRGKRVDLLIYDEAGSWIDLKTAVVQGRALCEVLGEVRGIQLYGGTGGDTGSALLGLKDIYKAPRAYKVLPYRHNYTQDGTFVETGFFIPYFIQSLKSEFMDDRGVCNTKAYKEYLLTERDTYLEDPDAYTKHCAENCWYAEEVFNLQGQNKFNKILITDLLADIRLHKKGPKIEKGFFTVKWAKGRHTFDNITALDWRNTHTGKVWIVEHPVWSECYQRNLTRMLEEAEKNGLPFEKPVYLEMHDLYVAGIDGIDIGSNQTSALTREASDFCIIIYKRLFGMNDPMIVAMYKDRPGNIREAYQQAMSLMMYYNARANIEATRMAMVTWARENGCLKYFMKRPRATLADIVRGNSNSYGTPATKTIIDQHTDLTADFVEDYCHTIWIEEILELLLGYNDEDKTKFDIIAALGMTFLADLELSGRLPTKVKPADEALFQDFGYYTDEHGHKQFGVIPLNRQTAQLKHDNDSYQIDSSDPRDYERSLQNGIYWKYSNYISTSRSQSDTLFE